MDDPREILRAAGVECAEVEAIYDGKPNEVRDGVWFMCKTDTIAAAILALARLVAKYKHDWEQAEEGVAFWMEQDQEHEALAEKRTYGLRYTLEQYCDPDCAIVEAKVADLDRRWEELAP